MSARNAPSETPQARAWRRQYALEHPEDPRHGTTAFARWFECKCPECKIAQSLQNLGYRKAKVMLHEPTLHRVAEHRAFKEPLCPDCAEYVARFTG
jgi:hypothetical protein